MKSYYYIFLFILLFSGCDTWPYDEFEEIESVVENPDLEVYYKDFSNGLLMDESGNNRDTTFTNFEVEESSDLNSTSFLVGKGEGSIVVPNLDMVGFDQLTFNFWMRGYAGDFEIILNQGNSDNSGYSNRITFGNDKILFGALDFNGQPLAGEKLLNDSLLNGEWNMVSISAGEINGNALQGEVNVYINGVLFETLPNSNLHFLESFHPSLFQNFDGEVDNIRIYSRALTAQEINSILLEERSDFQSSSYPFVVSDNLFAHYTFDDESVTDLKEGNPSISNAAFSFSEDTPDLSGHSASFANAGSQFQADYSLLDKVTSFSISFWITTDKTIYQPLLTQGISTNNNHGIIIVSGEIYCGVDTYPFNFEFGEFSSLVIDGNWHMITITCQKINDGSTSGDMDIYIDGIAHGETTTSSDVDFIENLPFIVGGDGDGSNFEGLLDNIRMYNRVLTSDEVQLIYNEER